MKTFTLTECELARFVSNLTLVAIDVIEDSPLWHTAARKKETAQVLISEMMMAGKDPAELERKYAAMCAATCAAALKCANYKKLKQR